MSSDVKEFPTCSLYEYILEQSAEHIDMIALQYFTRKISYRHFFEKIDECARALVALGVKRGETVSICLPNIPEAIYLFYAVSKIGAVANMIHPQSAVNEMKYYLNVSDCKYIFALDASCKHLCDALPETKVEKIVVVSAAESMPFDVKISFLLSSRKKNIIPNDSITWKNFLSMGKSITEEVKVSPAPDECAVILYSGGTTGKSKGIMLSNIGFNSVALQSIERCGCLKAGDRVLSVMPIFHGFGLGVCIHTVMVFGGTAVILPKFKAANFYKLLFKYKPNVTIGVPAIYESFLQNKEFEHADLSFLKCIICGGDSLSVSTKRKFDEMLNKCGCKTEIRSGYGLTESVTGICLMPENSGKDASVGLPYYATDVKIVDAKTDEELPYGESGEIIISGPSVMLGYAKEPTESANVLRKREDGKTWLYTGDIGKMDEDGYVYFLQRRKRVIISGGYNIYPQIIEDVINSHSNVLVSAAVGIQDDIMGQKCKAFIVLKDKNCDIESVRKEIRKLCNTNIARYALPREYIFIDEMPRTKVGKIAYTELQNL